MISRTWILLAAGLSLSVTGGCWSGELVQRGPDAKLHPSVRWVYRPGGQIGSSVFLFLPARVDNFVYSVELGDDCVVVEEWGNTSEMSIAWHHPRYALSLEDGSPLFARSGRRGTSKYVSLDDDGSYKRQIGQLPNGLAVVCESGGKVWIGHDANDRTTMVELAESPWAFAQSLDVLEGPGDTLVLASSRWVMCVDEAKLRSSLPAKPRAGSTAGQK